MNENYLIVDSMEITSTKTHPAERNKEPILDIFKKYLVPKGKLLEIGSGNGIHAKYFAKEFPLIDWYMSDKKSQQRILNKSVSEAKLENLKKPVNLEIGKDDFPKTPFDYVFAANVLHIMSWNEDKTLFKILGKRLRENSLVFFYGPFNYNGKFTTQSNEDFDKWLKGNTDKSGIRNYEDVLNNMMKSGFKILKDHEMPANNRMLVFERKIYEGRK